MFYIKKYVKNGSWHKVDIMYEILCQLTLKCPRRLFIMNVNYYECYYLLQFLKSRYFIVAAI